MTVFQKFNLLDSLKSPRFDSVSFSPVLPFDQESLTREDDDSAAEAPLLNVVIRQPLSALRGLDSSFSCVGKHFFDLARMLPPFAEFLKLTKSSQRSVDVGGLNA